MSGTFECANCHAVYPKTRPDQECWDELLDSIPAENLAGEEILTVCDDCYQGVMARVRAEAPHLLREEYR